MHRSLAYFLLILVGALPGGCSDEPEITAPAGGLELTLPFAASEEQLMANFVTAYEDVDYTAYLEVMDPDFRLYLQQTTIAAHDLPRAYYDYAEDCDITTNMFSAEAPHAAALVITDIGFLALQGVETWVDADDSRFPGARQRIYDVNIVFEAGTGDDRLAIMVHGQIMFFAGTEEVIYEGHRRIRYVLVGQVDATAAPYAKAAEDIAWGELKTMYRTPAEDLR